MLMFMVILQERMNIKHFQNVFDQKIFFCFVLFLGEANFTITI